MRVFIHNFVGLARETGYKLHEVVLAFHEIRLGDNLVFQWLHWRNNRVVDVGVGVDVCASGPRGGGGGLESELVFTVIVFIEFLMLDFANPRDVFQVVFELLIHEFREILSRHLILDIKLGLHLIQERLLDCFGAVLARDVCHCGGTDAADADAAADAADAAALRHHIPRGFHC